MQTITKKRLQVNITQDMLYPSALVPIRAKTFIGKMFMEMFYGNRTNLHEDLL